MPSSTPTRKRLLWIGGGLLIVLVLAWGLRPRALAVETAVAEIGPMQVTIDAEGQARAEEIYAVAAPVTGYVRRVPFEVGDVVREGAVIALLEPPPSAPLDIRSQAELAARVRGADAAVRAAEAQAAAARERAALASSTLARMRPLAADSVLAPVELDRYEGEVRLAEEGVAAAVAAVEAARQEREAVRALVTTRGGARARPAVSVRAPIGGTVLSVYRESEGVVAAGQPLVELGDADALEVVADVLSDEAARIAPGMRALVETGTATLPGEVERVEPVAFTKVSALGVEEQRVWIHVALPPPSAREAPVRLGHGYRVRVRFVEWEDAATLRIPTSALVEHDGGWAVFVVGNPRVRFRAVAVGHRAGVWAQVLDGLSPGDVVVTHPGPELADGTRVSVD